MRFMESSKLPTHHIQMTRGEGVVRRQQNAQIKDAFKFVPFTPNHSDKEIWYEQGKRTVVEHVLSDPSLEAINARWLEGLRKQYSFDELRTGSISKVMFLSGAEVVVQYIIDNIIERG